MSKIKLFVIIFGIASLALAINCQAQWDKNLHWTSPWKNPQASAGPVFIHDTLYALGGAIVGDSTRSIYPTYFAKYLEIWVIPMDNLGTDSVIFFMENQLGNVDTLGCMKLRYGPGDTTRTVICVRSTTASELYFAYIPYAYQIKAKLANQTYNSARKVGLGWQIIAGDKY